jgi:hypothetical protein
VEKATFKRVARPQIIDVPANALTDAPNAPVVEKVPVQPEPQINPADDLAAVNKELGSDIH